MNDDTINAQSTINLLQQIELQNPGAVRIHIICDNARYYHAQLVKGYRRIPKSNWFSRHLMCRTST
ncbi:hypothetical protein NSMM_980023 [Nitrosomonas mobilis]|uniref:Tc1-like transposase DDE domain-containing protein n=1 Tax=Nitrosomonas mobilis TaxID=51642 RepID=A0A1G5SJ23_9PROT|nr:hypothetical protein NSMM_980023 [Nitrosomonas mobilis]